MKNKEELAPPKSTRAWIRPDDYVVALAQRRTARRKRKAGPRTQTDEPHFLLSTLPFLILMAALLVITVGIVSAAWPGDQPQPQPRLAAHEQGVAAKGWFQEAEKGFH